MFMTRMALVMLAVIAFAGGASASDGDVILGTWWTPEKDGKFEMYRSDDNKYHGKILPGDGPERLDENNPDPALQSRSLVGVDFLAGFAYDADKGEWTGGTIYDPDNGRTYDARMWLDKDDRTKLNARGFVGISAFGRTATFTRVDESATQAGE